MRGRESGFPALTTPTGKAMVPSLLPRRVSGPEDGLQRRQLRGWTGTGRAGGYVVAIQSSSVCSKNLTAICCYRTLTRETRETPERHPQLLLPSVQRTWGHLLSAAPLWGAGDAVTRTPPGGAGMQPWAQAAPRKQVVTPTQPGAGRGGGQGPRGRKLGAQQAS